MKTLSGIIAELVKGFGVYLLDELESLFPTWFNGHGFLIRDYIRTILNYKRNPDAYCS